MFHLFCSSPTRFANVVACGWPSKHSPPLATLYSLAKSVHEYLMADQRNVAVVHCIDGKASSALLVCAVMLFEGLFRQPGGFFCWFSKLGKCASVIFLVQLRRRFIFRPLSNESIVKKQKNNIAKLFNTASKLLLNCWD